LVLFSVRTPIILIETHHNFPQFLRENEWKTPVLCPDSFFASANDSSFKYRVQVSDKLLLGLASTVILGSGTHGAQDHIFLFPVSEC
jgi:hypothetical protein